MSRHFLLFALLVAAAVCGAQCLKPLIRAPNDEQATGRYIAVLKETTSRERLLELVELLNNKVEGCEVRGYVELAVKAIIMELSDKALEKVSCDLASVVVVWHNQSPIMHKSQWTTRSLCESISCSVAHTFD